MIVPGPTIGQALQRPANGFTVVRLMLALMVVVSHAFSVTTGRVEDEPLIRLTGFTLGEHAVNGFFAVSGFLVTMSYLRRGPGDYVVSRALRIAPGLIAATLAVSLVLGPALTTLPPAVYVRSDGLWSFVLGTLTTFKSNAALPGVFADNPFRFPMGTVWTLKYEVLCYLGVLVAGLVGLFRGRVPAVAVAAGLFCAVVALDAVWPGASKGKQTSFRLCFLFASGGGFYVWRDRVPASALLAAGLAVAAYLLARTPAYDAVLFAAEAYGVIWLAFSSMLARPVLDLSEDLSYGIYLYGWPMQQALRQLWPAAGTVELLAPSLLLTVVVAAGSWWLIERPALRLKARLLARRTIDPATP